MTQILNIDTAVNAEQKPLIKKLDVLLGQPLSALLLKNMLHEETLSPHFELNRSQVKGYISEQSDQQIQVTLEFDDDVLIIADFQLDVHKVGKTITYHVYAVTQDATDTSTESIHKYKTSSLIDAYSFANNLLEQRKYLPLNVWGKDVFC